MDKDILRIAITELLYIKDAPLKVVVDEAVELAKNILQKIHHHSLTEFWQKLLLKTA